MEKTDTPTNLMQGLIAECNRVREIIAEYRKPELKVAGGLSAALMENSIKKAEAAMGVGDPIAMLQAYEDLKGYQI